MGTLGMTVIAVAAAGAFLFLLIILLGLRRKAPTDTTPGPVHPQAPSYRQQSEHMEYYRPEGVGHEPSKPRLPAVKRDPRKEPLPHCPLCDAAVGFDDSVCPKCRHSLKGI